MATQNISFMLLLVSLYLVASVTPTKTRFDQLSPSMQVSSDDLAFVSRICNKTRYPRLCLDTVVPALEGHRVDIKFVLEVSIDAGDEYAKVALSAVNRLAESGGTSQAVKVCKLFYNTVVDSYGKTLDAFAMNDVGTMTSNLGAVLTLVGDCEYEFVRKGLASPMSEYAEKVTELTSNCVAIIKQQ